MIGKPGWEYTVPATARDVTARLEAWRGPDGLDAGAIRSAIEGLRQRPPALQVLIVPGFLTDLLKPLKALMISNYLDAQESAVAELGAGVRRIAINTQASAAENAETIGRHVAASDRPVCLISHSKGGVDVLEFLLAAGPSVREKVIGWVSYQAPFAGSPIAQIVADHTVLEGLSRSLLDLIGGSGDALADMTVADRARYLADRDPGIRALAEGIGIVCLAASVGRATSLFKQVSPMYPTLAWMRRNGIPNDGLVPRSSAVLPHSRHVGLDPMDHVAAVSGGRTSLPERERRLLTQALVAIALEGR